MASLTVQNFSFSIYSRHHFPKTEQKYAALFSYTHRDILFIFWLRRALLFKFIDFHSNFISIECSEWRKAMAWHNFDNKKVVFLCVYEIYGRSSSFWVYREKFYAMFVVTFLLGVAWHAIRFLCVQCRTKREKNGLDCDWYQWMTLILGLKWISLVCCFVIKKRTIYWPFSFSYNR